MKDKENVRFVFKSLFFRGKMYIVIVAHFLSPSDANYRTSSYESSVLQISGKWEETYIVLKFFWQKSF